MALARAAPRPPLAARVFPSWGAAGEVREETGGMTERVINEGAFPLLLATPNPETTRSPPALTTGQAGQRINPCPVRRRNRRAGGKQPRPIGMGTTMGWA